MLTSDLNRVKRGAELLELVKWQVDFGTRFPGSKEHSSFREALGREMRRKTDKLFVQDFHVKLCGRENVCTNLVGLISTNREPCMGPLLLGTHFDTRPSADNEQTPSLRHRPILGANDGGSGTAVLLHLLDLIGGENFNRDILIVLFDAEDVGGIDGNQFSMGARFFCDHPLPYSPEEVIILDMIGGKNMVMDIDAHIFSHGASRRLTERIFALAGRWSLAPFNASKKKKAKYIVCDHTPFLLKGIPSCVLIDLDYPEWHTLEDLPEALSADSLVVVEDFLLNYLSLCSV